MFISSPSQKILHQTLACSPVIFLEFLVGISCGWMAPTLVILSSSNSELISTADQLSWLASISEVGRLLGTLISPLLLDNIGRKSTLFLITIVYSTVWFSTVFVRNIHILCMLRALYGFGQGMNDVSAGIYTIENCSANFRGIVGSVVLLTFSAAIFIEYVIAAYLSYTGTAIVNTVMAASVFASLYFCIETPYFLIMKGKREEAEKNLVWLWGNTDRDKVTEELAKIEQSIAEEKVKKRSLKLLFSSAANLKGIFVVVTMNVLGAGTGVTVLVTYASLIFSQYASHSGSLTTYEFTMLYGAAQLIATIFIPFIIERIDRRSLMIAGQIGIGFSNICSFALIYSRHNGYEIMHYPWLIFGSVALCSMSSALMSTAGFALRAELLPFSVRAIGSSMGITGFSFVSFCVIKAFLPISNIFGMEANFLMYSAISLSKTIFLYYALPETRGKSLHEL